MGAVAAPRAPRQCRRSARALGVTAHQNDQRGRSVETPVNPSGVPATPPARSGSEKGDITMQRSLRLILTVLLGATVLMRFNPPVVAQGRSEAAKAAVAARLAERIADRGQVNVIVGLALPAAFVREKLLTQSGVSQQRNAIASAHAALRGQLAGFGATEYASWRTLPYVAMKVGGAALQRLVSTPLVTSIQEDRLSPPALASSTHLIGADLTAASGFRGEGST